LRLEPGCKKTNASVLSDNAKSGETIGGILKTGDIAVQYPAHAQLGFWRLVFLFNKGAWNTKRFLFVPVDATGLMSTIEHV
jgi:hypothetical protein